MVLNFQGDGIMIASDSQDIWGRQDQNQARAPPSNSKWNARNSYPQCWSGQEGNEKRCKVTRTFIIDSENMYLDLSVCCKSLIWIRWEMLFKPARPHNRLWYGASCWFRPSGSPLPCCENSCESQSFCVCSLFDQNTFVLERKVVLKVGECWQAPVVTLGCEGTIRVDWMTGIAH
mgnify:CR=1 FL=1